MAGLILVGGLDHRQKSRVRVVLARLGGYIHIVLETLNIEASVICSAAEVTIDPCLSG